MRILEIEQGTPQWFLARLGVVSSSKFKDVMAKGKGLTRATYMRTLAAERLTGTREEMFQSDAMKRGNELEPAARFQFMTEMRMKVVEIGFCFMEENGKGKPSFIGSSTDGLIFKGKNKKPEAVLEIKCPLRHTHVSYLLDNQSLVKAYKAQIQGEMMVTGAKMGYMVSYHPDFKKGKDLLIVPVERDVEYIKELKAETIRFAKELHEMVEAINPPVVAIEHDDAIEGDFTVVSSTSAKVVDLVIMNEKPIDEEIIVQTDDLPMTRTG